MSCSTINSSVLPIGPTGPAGNGSLTIKDEGTTKTTTTDSIDFVGAGVTATNSGNNVTVTIPGLTSSTGIVLYNSISNAAATSNAAFTTLASYTLLANQMVNDGDYVDMMFICETNTTLEIKAFELVIAGVTANIKIPELTMNNSMIGSIIRVRLTLTGSGTNLFGVFEFTPYFDSIYYINAKAAQVFFEPVIAFDKTSTQLVALKGKNVSAGAETVECNQMIVTYFKKP